jgi:hypothetical protein
VKYLQASPEFRRTSVLGTWRLLKPSARQPWGVVWTQVTK